MDLSCIDINDKTAFELVLKSRSVEMHSRMQQLQEHDKKNINDYLNLTLKSIAHYILLNTKAPS